VTGAVVWVGSLVVGPGVVGAVVPGGAVGAGVVAVVGVVGVVGAVGAEPSLVPHAEAVNTSATANAERKRRIRASSSTSIVSEFRSSAQGTTSSPMSATLVLC
jgi:hypothetical protein